VVGWHQLGLKSVRDAGWIAVAWFEDDTRSSLAGISSGSFAAKILRKHAISEVIVLSWSPRLSPDFSSKPRRTAA
jgi:hypothetical protein